MLKIPYALSEPRFLICFLRDNPIAKNNSATLPYTELWPHKWTNSMGAKAFQDISAQQQYLDSNKIDLLAYEI